MTALAVQPRAELATHTGRPLLTAEQLVIEGQQRQLLHQYVQAHMVEGTDYGTIPGTEKKDKAGNVIGGNKTLLKPGAEKLIELFKCRPEYTIIEKTEDWDKPLFYYLFRCQIVSRENGDIVAEGFGSCSSRESKYRWRNADRRCPVCNAAAIKKSKFPPRSRPNDPPGWYCFDKAGGCSKEFAANDPAIMDQQTGKAENPDVADVVNTVLKMAKKRAAVDASIALARCGDMFTSDMEDIVENAEYATQHRQQAPKNPPPQQWAEPPQEQYPDEPHPDPEEFKAELKRTGQSWANCIAWVSKRTQRQYNAKTKPNEMDLHDARDILDMLKRSPNFKPAKTLKQEYSERIAECDTPEQIADLTERIVQSVEDQTLTAEDAADLDNELVERKRQWGTD